MQPYFFPYLGYFQLINSVDKFIIYDDVDFIKQGWINRNYIQNKGTKILFTVPLTNQSSNAKINETFIDSSQYARWSKKFSRTLQVSYSKAPFFEEIILIVKDIIHEEPKFISELAFASLEGVSSYLGIGTKFSCASKLHDNSELSGQSRVIDICKKEMSTAYHNSLGGQELYSYEDFRKNKIKLRFVKPKLENYNQGGNFFLPGLSMLDVLMFNSPIDINFFLNNYELICEK